MRAIWNTLLLSICISTSLSAGNLKDFFSKANHFFEKHVENGLVNYKAIQKDGTTLEVLVEEIAAIKPDKLSKNEQKAFYINSYNLFVIKNIISYYPISSPLDKESLDSIYEEVFNVDYLYYFFIMYLLYAFKTKKKIIDIG